MKDKFQGIKLINSILNTSGAGNLPSRCRANKYKGIEETFRKDKVTVGKLNKCFSSVVPMGSMGRILPKIPFSMQDLSESLCYTVLLEEYGTKRQDLK